MVNGLDAGTAKFEVVTVLEQSMLFTCCRVDRTTVPKGLHLYEVRHDNDMQGDPVEISDRILVNHWGTPLTTTPIKLNRHPQLHRSFREIDPEQDWNYEGYELTAEQYLEKYPPKRERIQNYVR